MTSTNYEPKSTAGYPTTSPSSLTARRPGPVEVTVVTLDEFAAVDEPGAEALLGDGDDALIPAEATSWSTATAAPAKPPSAVDLACHLAAGDDWLGITVARPLTVLLIENEGPRPLFRAKADRKLKAWAGSPLGGQVRIVETPWATLTLRQRRPTATRSPRSSPTTAATSSSSARSPAPA